MVMGFDSTDATISPVSMDVDVQITGKYKVEVSFPIIYCSLVMHTDS